MAIQLPPNSTGTVVDTRTVASKDRQVIAIGDEIDTYVVDVGFFGQMGTTGVVTIRDNTEAANYAYVSDAGRLRVGSDSLLFFDSMEGTVVNWNLWTAATTTMTVTQTGNFLILNGGNLTTINTDARVTSLKNMPYLGHFPLVVQFRAKSPALPQANAVMELGLGTASGRTAPTDGAFFRWDSDGAFYGVINNGGTETEVAITAPTANFVHTFEITVFPRRCVFRIDNGSPVSLNYPSGAGSAWGVTKQPAFARVYTLGTAPSVGPRLDISEVVVAAADLTGSKPWSEQSAIGRGLGLYDQPTTPWTQTAQWANAANPSTITPTNTAGGYASTILYGEFAIAAMATGTTQLNIFAYQVPAGHQAIITGVQVSELVLTGAAMGATATVWAWAVSVNASAVSMATAESPPTTWAPRAIPLGVQGMAASAAIGTRMGPALNLLAGNAPLAVADAGRWIHTSIRPYSGVATASAVLRGTVTLTGYFE